MSALPIIQKVILQPDRESKDLILTTGAVPTPKPSSTEHLVRVHTTAITNGELLWPKNFPVPEEYASTKESVPCYDVAGTVVIAPKSSPFPAGTEVYARASYLRTGCARKYTILVTEEMAERPQTLSWAESATVPMSAETAWQALFQHAGLEPIANEGAKGKRVFVTASSGGVGTWVVQLAKWAGAEVVGTCSSANLERVRSLGATEAIDYTQTNIKEWASAIGNKADVVIDCVGGKSLEDAWWVVQDGGVLISIFQPPEQKRPLEFVGDVKNLFFVMESNGQQLSEVTKLIAGENLHSALDQVFPLDNFLDAFARLDSGKTNGKVVLDVLAEGLKP